MRTGALLLTVFGVVGCCCSSIVLPQDDGGLPDSNCGTDSTSSEKDTKKEAQQGVEEHTMATPQKVVKGTFSIAAGGPWKTLDPFLFCAFHKDDYPVGNGKLGPDPSALRGRQIGSDFSGKDGWSMYHGDRIPGFPQHPHRGFETITITRHGWIDHFDSMGCHGRYGNGDSQWMTAGKGMQHCEMFPMLYTDKPNPLELFQIWINLPAKNKMVEPDYKMFWAHETAVLPLKGAAVAGADGDEAAATDIGAVRVIAGSPEYFKSTHGEVKVNAPPPNSWASQAGTDVAVWDILLKPGSTYTFPKAMLGGEVNRVLYFFEGDSLQIGTDKLSPKTAAKLDGALDFTLTVPASAKQSAAVLILQGKPLDEPVAQHGPFVMNTQQEIMQAFSDYRQTQFGGWPFDNSDPTNGHEPKKHAKYPDGKLEEPSVGNQ